MKSTMRYTFVAPGSLGKGRGRGRGRGLKSLGEKGNMPTKKLFSQSNYLVKHYIQETETSSAQRNGLSRSTLPSIEIVEKCCGPQTRSHVFGFGGGVKAKDLKGGTSLKAELLSALHSTQKDNKCLNEENKSMNEENKSLNDCLSSLEDEMKEIMKMKELFVAQHSHVEPATSIVSTK